MNVVSMQTSHLNAVVALSLQLGYEVSLKDLTERLSQLPADHKAVVAVDELGTVVGWAEGLLESTLLMGFRLDIAAMVVDEKVRGRGVGTALLAALETWARELGCAQARVLSRETRERAHAFYEGNGYVLAKKSFNFRKRL
jgi:GNAT superfamily N-acetyltransferase